MILSVASGTEGAKNALKELVEVIAATLLLLHPTSYVVSLSVLKDVGKIGGPFRPSWSRFWTRKQLKGIVANKRCEDFGRKPSSKARRCYNLQD